MMLDDDADEDQCPTSEHLQERLHEFCALLVRKVGRKKNAEEAEGAGTQMKKGGMLGGGDGVAMNVEVVMDGQEGGDGGGQQQEGHGGEEEEELSWVDKLAQLLISVPPLPKADVDKNEHKGTENFRLARHKLNNDGNVPIYAIKAN